MHRSSCPVALHQIKSWEEHHASDESMVRIVDFGWSRYLEERKRGRTGRSKPAFAATLCGSSGFMAPEIFTKQYGLSSDVFSFGALMFLLVFKQPPFPSERLAAYEEMMRAKVPIVFPASVPHVLQRLMSGCLSYEPDLRPDFETITGVLQRCLASVHSQSPRRDEDGEEAT